MQIRLHRYVLWWTAVVVGRVALVAGVVGGGFAIGAVVDIAFPGLLDGPASKLGPWITPVLVVALGLLWLSIQIADNLTDVIYFDLHRRFGRDDSRR